MKPLTLALALGALYLLTRERSASAASGAGPITHRAESSEPLTSPQDAAPQGFMYSFDYERGAWTLVPIP